MLYQNLKDAVLDLDPVLIQTLCGFTVEELPSGYRVTFRFALFGPDLANVREGEAGEILTETVAAYPDVKIMLAPEVSPGEQIQELGESELLGELAAVQIPPGTKFNDGDAPLWIVHTHSGSTAEKIRWLNSIG
jgi:hypothetical protein